MNIFNVIKVLYIKSLQKIYCFVDKILDLFFVMLEIDKQEYYSY